MNNDEELSVEKLETKRKEYEKKKGQNYSKVKSNLENIGSRKAYTVRGFQQELTKRNIFVYRDVIISIITGLTVEEIPSIDINKKTKWQKIRHNFRKYVKESPSSLLATLLFPELSIESLEYIETLATGWNKSKIRNKIYYYYIKPERRIISVAEAYEKAAKLYEEISSNISKVDVKINKISEDISIDRPDIREEFENIKTDISESNKKTEEKISKLLELLSEPETLEKLKSFEEMKRIKELTYLKLDEFEKRLKILYWFGGLIVVIIGIVLGLPYISRLFGG